jgi:hypothetical protein
MSWWAVTRARGRLAYLGTAVLAMVLVVISVAIWTSPSGLVRQVVDTAVDAREAPSSMVEERNRLLDALVEVKARLAELESTLAQTEDELGSVAAERNAVAAELKTLQSQLDSAQRSPRHVERSHTPTPTKPGTQPAGLPSAPAKAELVHPDSPYFGLMTEQAPHNWTTFDTVSQKIGLRPNSVGYFGGWDEPFRADAVMRAWQRGALPVLTWESRPISAPNNAVEDPEFSLPGIIGNTDAGVRGKFDDYLHMYARDIVAGGLPLGIRLNHEMNGDWYPWSERNNVGEPINGNRPGDFVKMWRHVHDIFTEEGAGDLVIWIWSPNITNNLAPANKEAGYLESLYPGDDYVDWIGIDGYNWGASQSWSTWTAPDAVFGSMVARLRSISAKPLALTETASSSATPGAVNVAAKSQWITQLFAYATAPATGARMIVWFNEDKETDWAVFGGSNGDETYRSGRTSYKAYASYRAAARAANLASTSSADPRLMSDMFFAGLW